MTTHVEKLAQFYRTRDRMPSYGELTTLLGFRSKNAATYWVERWLEHGVVKRDRTGRLLPGKALLPIRLLGDIQAGFPSPAEEDNVDTISLDDWLIEQRESSFMLRVSGDSMQDAGILTGDYVILERGRTPKNGDIVVAEVDSAWTMKYFERKNGVVALRSGNRRYPTLRPKETLTIAGVVTVVIRRYKTL
jgi:repressor LexA